MSLNAAKLVPQDAWYNIGQYTTCIALASTCKALKKTTDHLIQDLWTGFQQEIKDYPLISKYLTDTSQLNKNRVKVRYSLPSSTSDLSQLHQFLIIHRHKPFSRLCPSLKPEYFKTLEQEIYNNNFQAMWPRLREKLPNKHKNNAPKERAKADEIRQWLKDTPKAFANIPCLDFSDLELTIFPEELSTITMPKLEQVNLSHNYLDTLPSSFGQSWKKLKLLDLLDNRLQTLPSEVRERIKQLKTCSLKGNPLRFSKDQ